MAKVASFSGISGLEANTKRQMSVEHLSKTFHALLTFTSLSLQCHIMSYTWSKSLIIKLITMKIALELLNTCQISWRFSSPHAPSSSWCVWWKRGPGCAHQLASWDQLETWNGWEHLSSVSHGVFIRKPPICKHEGICAILRHSGSRISCHLVGNKHSYVVLWRKHRSESVKFERKHRFKNRNHPQR